jgi:threonine dehydrogenase-like Zn-dependent dehydrogenase
VLLKVVSTNICGSDQHMVRGRTTAESGLVLGHEITGEVIEKGSDVEFLNVGDLVSVPFNVACGRCRTCKEQKTGICLNVNESRAGGAYGYVDMGGWIGGQAEYVMVPYADFNLLRFPDKAQAMEKSVTSPCSATFSQRIPRGCQCWRWPRHNSLHCGSRPGRHGGRGFVAVAGCGRRNRWRYEQSQAGSRPFHWLRNS